MKTAQPRPRLVRTALTAVAVSLGVHGAGLWALGSAPRAPEVARHVEASATLETYDLELVTPPSPPPAPALKVPARPIAERLTARRASSSRPGPVEPGPTADATPASVLRPGQPPGPTPAVSPGLMPGHDLAGTGQGSAAPPGPGSAAPPGPESVQDLEPRSARPRGTVRHQRASMTAYATAVGGHLAEHRHYPRQALRMRLEGTAVLRLEIGAGGQLARDAFVLQSSGHPALDREALRMAAAAVPFPAPPDSTALGARLVDVPIQFALRTQ